MADETKLTAATRIEKLLDNIAGGENEVTPATRLEKFLSYIADAMEGGGGSGGGGCECGLFTVTITINDLGYSADKTYAEIAQLLSEGKKPVAFVEKLDGPQGIVSSNQYLYIENLVVVFVFEYSYQASQGAPLTYTNRNIAIAPDGTITSQYTDGTITLTT